MILLVDDDAAVAELVRKALAGYPLLGALHVVRNGEEAIAFLRREGKHAGAPTPALVLLGLDLLGMSGIAALIGARRDPVLSHTPFVVLASAAPPADVRAARRAGASCFVTKPIGLEMLLVTIRHLGSRWQSVAGTEARRKHGAASPGPHRASTRP